MENLTKPFLRLKLDKQVLLAFCRGNDSIVGKLVYCDFDDEQHELVSFDVSEMLTLLKKIEVLERPEWLGRNESDKSEETGCEDAS